MERKIKVHRPPAYLHFAVADRVTDGWKLQFASAQRYHSEHLLNLAPLPQPFRFAMKMECLKAMLPQLPPKTILVMLDAMDVLFNNSLDSLIATYHEIVRSLGKDSYGRAASILCNGEKNCWPIPAMAARYPEPALATPFPFLNSGVLIGPCEDILRVLQTFSWDEKTDDQFYWMQAYMESRNRSDIPRIEVDHHARLACCMHALPAEELYVRQGVAYLKSSGIRPALLHLNGPVKKHIRQVAAKIGVQLDKVPDVAVLASK
jgi:hypothetical protein